MDADALSSPESLRAMETNAVKFHGTPSNVTASRTIQRYRSTSLSLQNLTYRNKLFFPFSLTITRCSTTKSTETGQASTSESPQSGCLSTSPSSSSTRGLILDLGLLSTDSWDSEEIGSPVVKRFLSDNEERWYMWYHGSSKQNPVSDSIGLAVSNNGIHWERGKGKVESTDDVGLVMSSCEDWWAFDKANVRPGEVVIMSSSKVRANSSVYWMYYTGYTSTETVEFQSKGFTFGLGNPERFKLYDENIEKGRVFRSLPGLAISQDGRHWARIEGEHHSGALFDVGSEKDWDFLYIASPHVVFHRSGDLRMYYHSFNAKTGEFCIGMARSREGIKWVKLGKIIGGRRYEKEDGTGFFDELGVRYPCVTRNKRDGSYVMAYEGLDRNGKTSIGFAVSKDGIRDWERVQDEEAVLAVGEGGAWDNEGVGSPYLVEMDGETDHHWRLYYRGVGNGGRTGIGLAVSEGSEITTKFTKQTGIHL